MLLFFGTAKEKILKIQGIFRNFIDPNSWSIPACLAYLWLNLSGCNTFWICRNCFVNVFVSISNRLSIRNNWKWSCRENNILIFVSVFQSINFLFSNIKFHTTSFGNSSKLWHLVHLNWMPAEEFSLPHCQHRISPVAYREIVRKNTETGKPYVVHWTAFVPTIFDVWLVARLFRLCNMFVDCGLCMYNERNQMF